MAAWLECPSQANEGELALATGDPDWFGQIAWIARAPGDRPPIEKWLTKCLVSAAQHHIGEKRVLEIVRADAMEWVKGRVG